MEWKELLQELIELVENAAPTLWAIAVKQVYVIALQQAILAIAFGVFTYILYLAAKKSWQLHLENKFDDWDAAAVLAYIGSFGALIGFLCFFCALIARLVNPEYYAIRILINFVK